MPLTSSLLLPATQLSMSMMSCCICLEGLQCPVSLPCGHIFCRDCLKRVVQAVQPYSTLHACPTCRAHYYIPCPNLSTVPPHLRPYIIPSIRKVYLDLPSKPEQPDASTSDSPGALSTEIARLRAENDALRHNCCMWRKRAEVHSAATLGLLEMSKSAKDQIFQLAQERDQIRNEHRKLEHDYQQQKVILRSIMANTSPQICPQSPSASNSEPTTSVASSDPPSCPPSPPNTERSRKRGRTDTENDADCHHPPAKFARSTNSVTETL